MIALTTEVIDLYEQILAIHYNYEFVRKSLLKLELLKDVKNMIEKIADEIYLTGMSFRKPAQKLYKRATKFENPLLPKLAIIEQTDDTTIVELVKALNRNLEQICSKLASINELFSNQTATLEIIPSEEAIHFLSRPKIDLSILKRHLRYSSPIFRFALRLTAVVTTGYLLMLYVLPGKYSYWLLITILVIARPGFSTTKRRNLERISGSLIGVVCAYGLVCFGFPLNIQIVLITCFLALYLGFLYVNYLVSVVFITMVAIIGLHLLGGNTDALLIQRGYTVLLGGAMAIITAFLFPFWETRRIKDLMKNTLASHINLLEELIKLVRLQPVNLLEYKRKRKSVFVDTASLFASYVHLQNEPAAKDFDLDLLYHFQVYNLDLSSSITSLFHSKISQDQQYDSADILNALEFSLSYLKNGLAIMNENLE